MIVVKELNGLDELSHKPVLLEECIEGLKIKPDGTYIDGTIGGAGHSVRIYRRLGAEGTLVGIDQDAFAIETAMQTMKKVDGKAGLILVNTNFGNIKSVCSQYDIRAVDGILLDLGVSSFQLDDARRGFSYRKDAPLDMRMDRRSSLNAGTIVNEYGEEEIRKIIADYGEEKWAARIASFIVKARREKRIETTSELAELIKAAIPSAARRKGPHPAKRTFQALRIAVNGELEILEGALEDAIEVLKEGGRICVITFHSLEDRIVKEVFSRKSNPCTCPPDFPVCICGGKREVELITRKPVLPSKEEIEANPRARSAKLRIAQKVKIK